MAIEIKGNVNYTAVVIELKNPRKHINADRLLCWEAFGNNVITDLSSKEGELRVYFPLECAINPKILYEFNLYSDKNLNKDINVVGYFPKTGRVRAIRLRGERSEGVILPLEAVGILGPTKDLKAGDTFDYINGNKVCEKYLIKPTKSSTPGTQGKSKKKAKSRMIEGQFKFHIDTPHFKRNLHTLNPEDVITVTSKLHGCLPAKQTVTMADGTSKCIRDIKVGEYVLGYSHDKKELVPSKVLNTFMNGKTDTWFKIKKTLSIESKGKARQVLYCTGNHKIFDFKKEEYIPTSNLEVNSSILGITSDFNSLDKKLESILIGMLLGDAHIDFHIVKKWAIVWGHKEGHLDYIHYINSLLKGYSTQVIRKRVSGYGTTMYDCRTKHSSYFNINFSNFIANDKKVVPSNLVLDPISLAFWYMDDGSLAHTECQKDRANFAICGFSDEDLTKLESALTKFGFTNFTFYKSKNKDNPEEHNRLRLNSSDAEILFLAIREFIPPIMQYKLPENHRGYFKGLGEIRYENKEELTCLGEIISIEEIDAKDSYLGDSKYDIETETHNFFASDILIHNSSAVFANVLVKKDLNLFEKIKKKLGFAVEETKYDVIYSSRSVIKNDRNPTLKSYYDTDIWGIVHSDIKDKLPQGFTVYAEIVGFLPSGKAIQKGYDYGCNQFQHDTYVYRVTYTGADGTTIELSSYQLQHFCEERELKYVPVLYSGTVKALVDQLDPKGTKIPEDCEVYGEGHLLKIFSEEYLEKPCPYCKNNVPDEGVVIRKENVDYSRIAVLKHKSFAFLEGESKLLDSGEIDIETEESGVVDE